MSQQTLTTAALTTALALLLGTSHYLDGEAHSNPAAPPCTTTEAYF